MATATRLAQVPPQTLPIQEQRTPLLRAEDVAEITGLSIETLAQWRSQRKGIPAFSFATRAVAAGVDLPTLSAILGHTSIQMTMRYVHPAEEQKRFAAGKLETFRLAGMVEAMEKSRQATTISATVQ
jgi:integrase